MAGRGVSRRAGRGGKHLYVPAIARPQRTVFSTAHPVGNRTPRGKISVRRKIEFASPELAHPRGSARIAGATLSQYLQCSRSAVAISTLF
jgi:hypothetical protein